MQIDSHMSGDVQIVTLMEERLDAAVAIQFKDRMRAFSAQGAERIVLDMAAVRFLDSSGLGAVISAMKQMGHGRRLDLAGLTPAVAKVFSLTRMDTVFTIHADAAAATAGVRRAG